MVRMHKADLYNSISWCVEGNGFQALCLHVIIDNETKMLDCSQCPAEL